jgi:hypothetical protein
MRTFIILSVLSIAGFGCTDSPVNAGESILGEIIFESEYVNFAWGVSWLGGYIDENGFLHTFDRTSDPVQWTEAHYGMFTRDELQKKYLRRDTIRYQVQSDTLTQMKLLAGTISASTYSDTLSTGADMGLRLTSVYILRQESGMYQRIILSCEGDWTYSNTSLNAKTISAWLKQIR